MRNTSSPDVIIIGGGIIGCATALALSRAGYQTLSIDKSPAPGQGSTGHSCAIIRVYYSTLAGSAFAYDNIDYWKNWRDFLEAPKTEQLIDYRSQGCLVLKSEGNGLLKKVTGHMDELAIPYEAWTPDQIRAVFPGVCLDSFYPVKRTDDPLFAQPNVDPITGAIYFPEGGYISDPVLATANLCDAAKRHGAEFRYRTAVASILQSGGKVQGVTLADGTTIHAPKVINVAGPHSAVINGMAGVLDDMRIKTRALRHEVAHIPAPAGMRAAGHRIFSDSDAGCYFRPEGADHVLIGSEDPPCDPREWVENPDEFHHDFTDFFTTMLMRAAQRFPDINVNAAGRGVIDLYDVSDDWIPIYDRAALEGYFMAIGSSGNQFKNAPVAGMLMTALVQAQDSGINTDTAGLMLNLKNAQFDLDSALYSRNRAINHESSFSVLG